MHQHSTDQAVLFLIPLMEREIEPVYLYFLYILYLNCWIASLANLHMHVSLYYHPRVLFHHPKQDGRKTMNE